jgi:hypothetical protein
VRPLLLRPLQHLTPPLRGTQRDSWFPEDLPREGHQRYWKTVTRLRALALSDRIREILDLEDQLVPVVAFFECTGRYTDSEVAQVWPLVSRPVAPPDLCMEAFSVGIWNDPVGFWPTLLTKALPNACKVRTLHAKLVKHVTDRVDAYDAVLRILLHALWGTFGGHVPSFDVRVMCYAALALYPPSPNQLAAFILDHKNVVSFALRDFVLSLIDLTPLGTLLRQRYPWQDVVDGVREGMDLARQALEVHATDRFFLQRPWGQVEDSLFALNQLKKSLCFRAKRMPFHKQVLADMRAIERKHSGGALTVRRISPLAELRSGGPPPVYASEMAVAEQEYNSEQKLTGAKRLLIGTERKPPGIFITDRPAYELLAEHYAAVDRRKKIRWGYLPKEWAILQRRHGLGTFMLCPVCCEARATPLVFPQGKNARLRFKAHFMQDVKVDLRTLTAQCAARDTRHRDRIVRRRARSQRDDPVHSTGADIEVCHRTPLVNVHMVGVVLETERDGPLLLCVDCGALMRYTPESWTVNGPTCGCKIVGAEPHMCAICRAPAKKAVRRHIVLTPNGCRQVEVCMSHRTRWVDRTPSMVTLSTIRKAVLGNQRFIRVGDHLMFLPER